MRVTVRVRVDVGVRARQHTLPHAHTSLHGPLFLRSFSLSLSLSLSLALTLPFSVGCYLRRRGHGSLIDTAASTLTSTRPWVSWVECV